MNIPRIAAALFTPGVCVVAAALGWLCAGMTLHKKSSARPGLTQIIAGNASPADQEKDRTAGGFAHLQAVAAHQAGGSLTILPAAGSLATSEAEDLAQQLLAEGLARRAQENPDAFLADLARRNDDAVSLAALNAWAARDPEGAFLALLASPHADNYSGREVFTAMARRDLARTLTLLKSPAATHPFRLDAAWSAAFQVWAERDLNGLQARLPSLGSRAGEAAAAVGAVLSDKDPAAAIAWARSLSPDCSPQSVINQIVSHLNAKDPALAAPWFNSQISRTPLGYVYDWTRSDLEGAARWVLTHPDSKLNGDVCLYGLTTLASANTSLAQSLYSSLDADGQARYAEDFAAGLARRDPSAALQWATSLPDEKARQNALAGAALANTDEALNARFIALVSEIAPAVLLAKDPAPAAQSLAALPAESQEAAWDHMKQLVEARPARSVAVVEALPETPLRCTAAATLAASWSFTDPSSASAWVTTLPEGDSRAWAAQSVLYNWARYDFAAAQKWLDTFPPGPTQEKGSTLLKSISAVAGIRP